MKNIISIDGDECPDSTHDLARISVIERNCKNGNIGNGFVRDFSLNTGAVASTVCHDHHNIFCVRSNYLDMVVAVHRLGEIEGGFVVVQDESIFTELPLPKAGLMSDQPFEIVHGKLED